MATREDRLGLRQALLDHGLLFDTGVTGVFGKGAAFERIVAGISRCIERAGAADRPERRRFGPVTARQVVRATGYMDHFPQLCGSVHAFCGNDAEHALLKERVQQGSDWAPSLGMTELVLTPAACYPLYPTLAGVLPQGGLVFDVTADCFRHEPSDDPARMQSFRMHENVRVGEPDAVKAWRESWMERGEALLRGLGLDARRVVASDPFFGRAGRLMREGQASQTLKFELVAKVASSEEPTALASFNYHQEHFGKTFGIATADGEPAHTACMGFGLERVTLALLVAHGFDVERWPTAVKQELWA